MSYKMTLKSGKCFWETSSAFQKCIRRGMEHEALYYGTEFYNSGYDEYVWKRLKIIASEDVGLANPNLVVQISSLYTIYTALKKDKGKSLPERLPLVHAIMLAVRSPKSRLVDNKLCYYFDLRDKIEEPVFPDFVYDMHTARGKALKRGNDFFFEESAKITNVPDALSKEEFEYRDMVWNLYKERDEIQKRSRVITPESEAKLGEGLSNKRRKLDDEFDFEAEDDSNDNKNIAGGDNATTGGQVD